MKVIFLDVGQGDSALVLYPKGRTIMIDTGGIYNSDYSILKNKIIPYLIMIKSPSLMRGLFNSLFTILILSLT